MVFQVVFFEEKNMAVYRNGKLIGPEVFDDIPEVERTEALRKLRERKRKDSGASGMHGGGSLSFGTPRKGKNTKVLIQGVRVR